MSEQMNGVEQFFAGLGQELSQQARRGLAMGAAADVQKGRNVLNDLQNAAVTNLVQGKRETRELNDVHVTSMVENSEIDGLIEYVDEDQPASDNEVANAVERFQRLQFGKSA